MKSRHARREVFWGAVLPPLLGVGIVALWVALAFAQTVRAVPSQYGVNFNQSVGGTGAIVWSSATAVTNQSVRLYRVGAACTTTTGIGSLTIVNTSNSATWVQTPAGLPTGIPAANASYTVLNFSTPLTALQSSSLTVTLGCYTAAGAASAGTLDIQADRY